MSAAPAPSGAFRGKISIVTGGSRGIGKAIAIRLAKEGATVVIASRTEAALAQVAAEVTAQGGVASIFPTDLREPEAPALLLQHTIGLYGGVDIVVNNAGAAKAGDFLSFTDADWEDGFALKFFGAVRLSKAAWPHLRDRRGALLNIIGIGGRTPSEQFTIAGSVNGAFLSFTKALADRGVRDGVRVNAINPGPVRTDRYRRMVEQVQEELRSDEATAIAHILARNKMRRLGETADIANLAAFILSEQGDWFQGALIDMDGGQTKSI